VADSKAQAIIEDRAHKLSLLEKHPSWPEYKAEIERKREKKKKVLLNSLLGASTEERSRLVDEYKGFDSALDWATGVVEQAEATLQRELRKQQIAEELHAEHR
jgi:hypothetical protein